MPSEMIRSFVARRPMRSRPYRRQCGILATKMIRPVRNETEYDEALEEIEPCFASEPKPGTPEADRFDLLALIIEDYERKHWPIDPPETIDAIRYRMETGGYTQADLGRLLGSPQRASDNPDEEAPPHDENGLETAPRMEHSGRGSYRAAEETGAKVSGVKSTASGGDGVYRHGAPRPMRIGNIASQRRYDGASGDGASGIATTLAGGAAPPRKHCDDNVGRTCSVAPPPSAQHPAAMGP